MIIGLTGGIASGKSLCSNYFVAQGVSLVDADVLAREIVEKGSPVLQSLVCLCGDSILQVDGSLNRGELRRRIFSDYLLKQKVNTLMHPVIRDLANRRLIEAQQQSKWVIYSAPLLFENCLENDCDLIIVVDVPENIQIQRGMERDASSRIQIEKIITTQISRQQRLTRANYIIDNSQSIDSTEKQCGQILTLLANLKLGNSLNS